MKFLLVLPVVIPLATAALLFLLRGRVSTQRRVSVAGTLALLVSSLVLLLVVWRHGIQAVSIGNWDPPLGIPLVADLFSSIMVVLAGLMGAAVGVYSLWNVDVGRQSFGYFPLMHILLMGVCGAFLTGDLFNLYVWFEVLLIASFVLLVLGGDKAQLEGALKYVSLNLLASGLFLAGVGIIYAAVGTLNMADLARKLDEFQGDRVPAVLAMLFLVAFGIKAAIFPLFFWLPASYHTPPVAVSAIFAGLLTKVGVYALIRVFTLLFVQEIAFTHTLLLVLAALTMATGVLGAVAQNEFRRILAFHIVSQIGYMIMGLALYTPLGLAGSIFYLIHHIVVKTNLFLISGVSSRLRGTEVLKNLGGLYHSQPGLAVLFLISALSLAGLPPLSGFFGKLILVRAGLEIGEYAVVATAVVVSLLTLFSMSKIWIEVFWKPLPGGSSSETARDPGVWRLLPPIILLALVTVAIGLGAGPVYALSAQAAEQLLHPDEYIRTVLKG